MLRACAQGQSETNKRIIIDCKKMKRRRSIEAEDEMKWQQSSDGLNNPHTHTHNITLSLTIGWKRKFVQRIFEAN